MRNTINPLRYPGAKRALVNYVESLLEFNDLKGVHFYEPYAGSAVVGIELLKRGTISRLTICEKDVLLYSFWMSVFFETDGLCRRIQETPITIETWSHLNWLRKIKDPLGADLLDLGYAALFYNRTNFSGILSANPIGGINQKSNYKIDCRFNKKRIISVIEEIAVHRHQVEVIHDDALSLMNNRRAMFLRHPSFAYFDPPYYEKGASLYRHYYENRDHRALRNFVKEVKGLDWLISYDDAPYICGLYGNEKVKYQPFHLDYSCSNQTRVKGKELLISNLPLPPVEISKANDL